jgi:Flp pilus assembly pilin Flp
VGNPGLVTTVQGRSYRKEKDMQNLKNKRGQGIVEYIMLVSLVAVGVVLAVRGFSTAIKTKFTTKAGQIATW